jgi:glycosyltransferase involved in cell wall biosynthesis
MHLTFIMDMEPLFFEGWDDGLHAALQYLVSTYNWKIDIYNVQMMKNPSIPSNSDFVLFWGAFDKKQHYHKIFKKQGLCFGGGPTRHPLIKNFDIVFAENSFDIPIFESQGTKSIRAFGTNTQLFRPLNNFPKIFDLIYPAAFAKWKHHEKFSSYFKEQKEKGFVETALAVGQKQANGWEKECYEVCEENGVMTMDWVPSNALVSLYNASKTVYLSPDDMGGCQRAVLETIACGVPLIVDSSSPRLAEFKDYTRDRVLNDFSEKSYGESLKRGIEMVLGG